MDITDKILLKNGIFVIFDLVSRYKIEVMTKC